ncbi:MAG: hypothetical protein KatS3mg111_4045 [Pirellulaceae bacterium]|nr:MAG: hypothetical protein KatS3mg111_4045 [Pirellulaceae bacterium]
MFRAVLLLIFLCAASSASAQPRRGGGPRSHPFGDALREIGQRHPERELFELLLFPHVRAEIDLSDQEYDELSDQLRQLMERLREIGESTRGTHKTKQEWIGELEPIVAAAHEQALKYLKEHADYDRLLELYVQQRNYSAASNEEVAMRIGLTGEDLEKFREAKREVWHRLMEDIRPEMDRVIRAPNFPREQISKEMERLFRHAHQRLDEELAELLPAEQRQALERMRDRDPFKDLPPPGARPWGGPPRERGPRRDFDNDEPPDRRFFRGSREE